VRHVQGHVRCRQCSGHPEDSSRPSRLHAAQDVHAHGGQGQLSRSQCTEPVFLQQRGEQGVGLLGPETLDPHESEEAVGQGQGEEDGEGLHGSYLLKAMSRMSS